MDVLNVILIAAGLSVDAFAVALGIGSSGAAPTRRDTFRLAYHFGLFQFLMPILGWYLGSRIAPLIESVDHWIAFALLTIVGAHMIRAGYSPEHQIHVKNPSRGMSLVVLSVATSIDALAVGLSLAMLGLEIFSPSVLIGCVTFAFTVVGMRLGNRLNGRFGKRMERIGGIVLILIAIRILVEHL
jgi:putative Mn2+ efflux pump MntP